MRVITFLLLGLYLSGCAAREINVTSRPLELNIGQVADPTPLQLNDVNFRVLNQSNIQEFLNNLESQGDTSKTFIALRISDYENIILNLADLRRYIEQQQSLIVYYRRLTAPAPTSVD